MNDETPYNPLDRDNLAASVAEAMLERDVRPLGNLASFPGAGIYAIYYTGDFPAYAPLAERNRGEKFAVPIYVGKAIPKGRRKGKRGSKAGNDLFKRLREHADSIHAAENLEVEDFSCRFLVTEDIWIPLGEALLIAKFGPIWNRLIDGFGNHNPGKGRYEGMRPRWDLLHPGRAWAEKCQPRQETKEQVEKEIAAYLRSAPLDIKPKLLGDES